MLSEEIINILNIWGKICLDIEKSRALSKLENDIQKSIYLDWWNGYSLWKWNEKLGKHERAEKYKNINDYDFEKAYEQIMTTISNGMG